MIDLDAIRRNATRLGKVNLLVGVADFDALVKEVAQLRLDLAAAQRVAGDLAKRAEKPPIVRAQS